MSLAPVGRPIGRRLNPPTGPARPFGARWHRGPTALVVGLLAACQTYEEQPLRLGEHLEKVDARAAGAAAVPEPGITPGTFDLADGASLDECEVLALFYNADLRLARQRAGIAEATRDHAGLWRDPVFGFDAAKVLSRGNDFEYGALLSVTLPISGRLGVQRDRAGAAYDAELSRIADAEWNVRANVRQAFVRWATAERRKVLLADLLASIERVADITAQLEAAGALSIAQSRLIQIERSGRQAEFLEFELGADLARVQLLGLMGLGPDSPLVLESTYALPPVAAETLDVDAIQASNTALAVARAQYRVAEESLRLQIQRQYPDLTLGLGPGGVGDDTRILFGFSLPIPVLNRNAQAIAQARAQRETARVAAEVTLERIVRDARRSQVTLASVARQRGQIEGALRPLLEDQSNTIDALAELGDVDAFLILETVGRQYDAATRLLELEQAESLATIELHRLIGPPHHDADSAPASETEETQP